MRIELPFCWVLIIERGKIYITDEYRVLSKLMEKTIEKVGESNNSS